MIHYVDTIDELVDIIDREYSGKNAVCPICKHEIGTVGIPDIDIGLPVLKYTQFKCPGVYCVEGHTIISMGKEEEDKAPENQDRDGLYKILIDDLGIKVFEVMKLIRPLININQSISNTQLYWMMMKKDTDIFIKDLSYDKAEDILYRLQKLGARVRIVRQQ